MKKVKMHGVFQVLSFEEEYAIVDPVLTGSESGVIDLTNTTIDNVNVGDNISFGDLIGEVIRSNDVFTKVSVKGLLFSIPNHKIMEVA